MSRSFSLPRTIAIVGALVVVVSFFLPWVVYQNGTFSGANLAGALGPALAAIKAGGIKGYDIALWAVPILATIGGALVATSWSRQDRPDETRLRLWAVGAAVAGLALALLFLGSAVLSGTPGIQFEPGLVRTDNSVKATIAKAINAGDFVSIGAGVYFAIAGFVALILGAILARQAQPAPAWRTQDYVLLAVLAVVFGAVYWWWLAPYLGIAAAMAQVGQELLFGMWFVGGLLGGYIIRRPGAAFLAETLAALGEVLLGAPAGPVLVVTGFMQAIGPEVTFAATGYRSWGWRTMLVAGVAAGLFALPWNWFRLGYFALDPTFLLALLAVRIVSGALAGAVAKVLGDAIAATGSLNHFAIGRERVREV